MQGRYVYTSKEPSCWHVIEAFARRSPRAEWHSSRGRHGRAPASQWAARAKRASSRPCTLGRRSDSRCSCLLLLPLAAAPGRVAPPPSSALLNGRVLYSLLAATGGSVSRTASLLSPSTLPLIPTEPPPSPAATRHIRARWTRDRDGDPHRPTTTTSQPVPAESDHLEHSPYLLRHLGHYHPSPSCTLPCSQRIPLSVSWNKSIQRVVVSPATRLHSTAFRHTRSLGNPTGNYVSRKVQPVNVLAQVNGSAHRC
jgi:hypothetical protein